MLQRTNRSRRISGSSCCSYIRRVCVSHDLPATDAHGRDAAFPAALRPSSHWLQFVRSRQTCRQTLEVELHCTSSLAPFRGNLKATPRTPPVACCCACALKASVPFAHAHKNEGHTPPRYTRDPQDKMQNESGEVVDTYIPRKCSASGRIVGAKDHASVQIAIAEVDEKTGRMNGNLKHLVVSGFIRGMGESDGCLNRLCSESGILATVADQQ